MMFPSQSQEDLISVDPSIFQLEALVNLEEYPVAHEDQDSSVPAGNSSNLVNLEDKTERKTRKPSLDDGEKKKQGVTIAEKKGKRILHKEVERQRRKEMTDLYASLRSLLPLEYIKGKRAVSDHMDEAVNYIKDMKKDIQELSLRRDKLKKLYTSGSTGNVMINSVTVNPCKDGAEILILTGSDVGIPLSRVLDELIRLNLNVLSCVSTRTSDQNFHLHRILIEAAAGDLSCINPSALREKVLHGINLDN